MRVRVLQRSCGVPAQDATRCQDDSAFNDILQFPHVPRPVMTRQSRHDFLRDRVDGFALLSSERFDKLFHKQWNIVTPLPQRGKGDGKRSVCSKDRP
jgi:hypothetical protein